MTALNNTYHYYSLPSAALREYAALPHALQLTAYQVATTLQLFEHPSRAFGNTALLYVLRDRLIEWQAATTQFSELIAASLAAINKCLEQANKKEDERKEQP